MKAKLETPYQCTGCEARWDSEFIDMYCEGSIEELQHRHRQTACWQFPWEAYKHVIVDIREPIPNEFVQLERINSILGRTNG